MNSQYTLAKSFGNTADYDEGYNTFDVRHTFNVSALYSLPYGRGRKWGNDLSGVSQVLLGGWDVGTIVNARSGLPIQVQVPAPTCSTVIPRRICGLRIPAPRASR